MPNEAFASAAGICPCDPDKVERVHRRARYALLALPPTPTPLPREVLEGGSIRECSIPKDATVMINVGINHSDKDFYWAYQCLIKLSTMAPAS